MRLVRCFLALVLLAVSFGASADRGEFQRLERQLRLKPHQKELYYDAAAATQLALVASAMSLTQLKQELTEELLKPRPDFAGLLAAQGAAYELNRPLFEDAAAKWSRLYALLEDDQIVILRRFVERKLGSLPFALEK